MSRIIISPFAQILRDDPKKPNPKNWPYWSQLLPRLVEDGHSITQMGRDPELKFMEAHEYAWSLPLKKLEELIWKHDLCISVDNFCHHFIFFKKIPIPAVVIWSRSDPNIYGYKDQVNILKSPQYFRKDSQFKLWEQCPYDPEAYISVDVVYKTVSKILAEK